MKKSIVLIAVMLVTAVGFAQEHPRGERGPNKEEMFQKLAEELELTSDQKTEVKAILEDSAEKRKELKEKGKEERKAAMEAHMKEMEAVLSPEQFEKYKEMQEDRMKRKREHSNHKPRMRE